MSKEARRSLRPRLGPSLSLSRSPPIPLVRHGCAGPVRLPRRAAVARQRGAQGRRGAARGREARQPGGARRDAAAGAGAGAARGAPRAGRRAAAAHGGPRHERQELGGRLGGPRARGARGGQGHGAAGLRDGARARRAQEGLPRRRGAGDGGGYRAGRRRLARAAARRLLAQRQRGPGAARGGPLHVHDADRVHGRRRHRAALRAAAGHPGRPARRQCARRRRGRAQGLLRHDLLAL